MVAAADEVVEKMPGGTEHILLVEDDPSVRRLSKETLLRLGYSASRRLHPAAPALRSAATTRATSISRCAMSSWET